MTFNFFYKKIFLANKVFIRSVFRVTGVVVEMNLTLGEVGNSQIGGLGGLGPLTRVH